jgi:thioredoxin reductase (NADPH)
MDRYDVVVVGGGAAGLSGAVALVRSRRSVLVVDAGEPRNAPADGVHNLLGQEGRSPAELLAAGRDELRAYGGSIIAGTAVGARRAPQGDFEVELDDGSTVRARRLLVATGLVDELPAVPGVQELWGTDVLHCPYCHGYEARDQAVGILATSPLAMHGALLWRQLTDDVTVFLPRADLLSDDDLERLAARDIATVLGEVAALETTDGRLSGVRLVDGTVVPRRYVVVAPRFTARSAVLSDLGLEPEELRMGETVIGTAFPTGPDGATAVPGVHVAGNVADLRAQVVVSAAQGLMAGARINAELVEEDTARAVSRRTERVSA